MTKKLFLLCLLTLAVFSFATAQDFEIISYDIDMEVLENNSYNVTEDIRVYFREARRGIFRDLPLFFDTSRVKIHSVDVPGYEYKITRNKDNLNIRIGNPDIYLEGEHLYTIKYVYDVGKDSLPDMDEFNHNLIGLGWDTIIHRASFNVRLPKPFNAEDVNCTSGPYGSTDNTNVTWKVDGQQITGQLIRSLGPYEGLTLALPLPEGYWVNAKKHLPPLSELLTSYPLYVLAIVFCGLLWNAKGRDNKIFPTIEFEAPDSLNPAELGYVVDGTADSKDITSLIVYWAQKGHLLIDTNEDNKKEGLKLIRQKELGTDARDWEQKLFKDLFRLGKDGVVTTKELTNKFYTRIGEAQHSLKTSFTSNPQRRIFDTKSDMVKIGGLQIYLRFIMGIVAFLPMFFISFETTRLIGEAGPLVIFFLFMSMFIMFGAGIAVKSISTKGVSKKAEFGVGVGMSLILSLVLGFISIYVAEIPAIKFFAALISSLVAAMFIALMSKRTAYGDELLAKILGFRTFIEKAEKEKLERMFESDPQYFYNILPWAMVMGLSSKWASHFDGMSLQPPQWYHGYHYNRFNTRDFERSLSRNFSSISNSMSSSPQSSGSGSSGSSSGGGFSGGGSGGGGGGSW